MKRRRLLLFFIIVIVVLVGAVAYYIYYKSHIHELEYIDLEIYDAVKYDEDLLIGKWQLGTVFYRFEVGGVGATWDESDDVTEDEASSFNWELNKSKLIHYHEMQYGGYVPKTYQIKHLDLGRLVLKDYSGEEFSFVKVE